LNPDYILLAGHEIIAVLLGETGGRMNPNPGSGRAVPYGAQFTLALIQMNAD